MFEDQISPEQLDVLGIEDIDQFYAACDQYIDLLKIWNQIYNLVAVSTLSNIVQRHFVDCLSIKPFCDGQYCLDVGSGAGFPGMVLALAMRHQQWTLLDSNRKKICFLRHVKSSLNLSHVEIRHSRVEDYQPKRYFDTITSRAFASLPRSLVKIGHLLTEQNQFLAMKGKSAMLELRRSHHLGFLVEVIPLTDLFDAQEAYLLRCIRKHSENVNTVIR